MAAARVMRCSLRTAEYAGTARATVEPGERPGYVDVRFGPPELSESAAVLLTREDAIVLAGAIIDAAAGLTTANERGIDQEAG